MTTENTKVKELFYCECESNGGKRCLKECETCKTIPINLKIITK